MKQLNYGYGCYDYYDEEIREKIDNFIQEYFIFHDRFFDPANDIHNFLLPEDFEYNENSFGEDKKK